MTAIALPVLFVAAALLGAGTIAQAWRTFGHRFAELRDELREVERGAPIRISWREPALPAAAIHRLKFTPRAERSPLHPHHDLRAAA